MMMPGGVPPRLAARMRALEAGTGPLALGRAVEALRAFGPRAGLGRDEALELLAIDAVVTIAVARLAETPDGFDARCRAMMRELASGEEART